MVSIFRHERGHERPADRGLCSFAALKQFHVANLLPFCGATMAKLIVEFVIWDGPQEGDVLEIIHRFQRNQPLLGVVIDISRDGDGCVDKAVCLELGSSGAAVCFLGLPKCVLPLDTHARTNYAYSSDVLSGELFRRFSSTSGLFPRYDGRLPFCAWFAANGSESVFIVQPDRIVCRRTRLWHVVVVEWQDRFTGLRRKRFRRRASDPLTWDWLYYEKQNFDAPWRCHCEARICHPTSTGRCGSCKRPPKRSRSDLTVKWGCECGAVVVPRASPLLLFCPRCFCMVLSQDTRQCPLKRIAVVRNI